MFIFIVLNYDLVVTQKTPTMADSSTEYHEIIENEDFNRSYETIYIAEIRHTGLETYRVIKDKNHHILRNKVRAQFNKWDQQWYRLLEREMKEESKALADELTLEANEKQEQLENTLIHTLSIDDTVDWDEIKDHSTFKEAIPTEREPPQFTPLPEKPDFKSFKPNISTIEKLIRPLSNRKEKNAQFLYSMAIEKWEREVDKISSENQKVQRSHDINVAEYKKELSLWEQRKQMFYSDQEEANSLIGKLKQNYEHLQPEAILEYCELVLNASEYPDSFPQDFDLDYSPQNKLLIVEYQLPSPDDLPNLKEVKYIASRNEMKEYYYSERQMAQIYDDVIYKILLRTVHELFEADQVDAIESIAFNGWVRAIDKSTGKEVNSCIVSVHTTKSDFLEIDLGHVEPKSCFKGLKGIGSSKLSGITAIQPIVHIERKDKRFITSKEVSNQLNEGYNVATMDWADFEHLLREIFEKEFSVNGGEVKVTQASRDGGVDAIAFDPDPIRGGKIVIQAKRYTNTVGVAAVRDLYGTVVNEGATKGILVTTSDYGPDAYEFSKNKPITLMNGSNLLYLLERHGHKARIDIVEAKKLLGSK